MITTNYELVEVVKNDILNNPKGFKMSILDWGGSQCVLGKVAQIIDLHSLDELMKSTFGCCPGIVSVTN